MLDSQREPPTENHEPDSGAGRTGGVFTTLTRLLWGGSVEAPLSHAPARRTENHTALDDTRDATPEELDPLHRDDAYRDTGTVDAETLAEIREQLADRRKIGAIKLYREAAGCDLKSAKEAVDRIARENGVKKAA